VTEPANSHESQGNADGVSLRRVSKTYGLATVLRVDELIFRNGEVTGLVGENGAGKSTMLGILAGTVTPDPGGEVFINGEPVHPGSPSASQAAGVAMVSQEFPLVGQLSVAENLTLGMRPVGARGFFYDRKATAAAARGMLERVELDIDPRTPVSTLSIPARQLLEVAKALGRNPRLLILDEPTSALGPVEAGLVIRLAREQAGGGGAVIFVGHRLEEVREAADRVVVLRNGALVADMAVDQATDDRLIKEMVGREHLATVTADHSGMARPAPVFTAEELTAEGLGPVSLSVSEGEVLGVAGLMGSGRSRLLHTIFGAIAGTGGTMTLAGSGYAPRSTGDAVAVGVALVPEDRKQQSILASAPVRWNVTLATLRRLSRSGFLFPKTERVRAREFAGRTGARFASIEQPIGSLSGGNQQRVIFGKWFAAEPKLLLLDEPTRGVDVGAKAEIYGLIDEARARGMAVIVASSELEELFHLADQIVVLRHGRIGRVLAKDQFSKEQVLLTASGVKEIP
jgi:ABC-type sugar transport system ATPase subunit